MKSRDNGLKKILKKIFMKNISGWTLLVPALILLVLIVWRPIMIGIGYSFFDLKGFDPVKFCGLKNYRNVITDTEFIKTLLNTVQYVVWSLIIGFMLPFLSAVMINEMGKSKGFFKVSTYLPVIIPGVANSLIWQYIYRAGDVGLLNMVLYYLGFPSIDWLGNKELVIPMIIFAMTWNGFGGTVILYLASLQGINQELYEAARIDGTGLRGRFVHVLFPYIRGTLLLLGIRQIIGVFQVVEQPMIMTGGGPSGASLTLGLTSYNYAFVFGKFGKSLALSTIMFIMLMFLSFVYFRLDRRVND